MSSGGGTGAGTFSTGLKLTDLNDFVSPSQTCVLPMQGTARLQPKSSSAAPASARPAVEHQPSSALAPPGSVAAPIYGGGSSSSDTATSAANSAQVARVSLSDCLSCSGCLTSAETVLLDQQSLDAFLERCSQPARYTVVVSVSPQAVSSLATYWGVDATPHEALCRVASLFRALGARYVVDTALGRCLSVLETCREAEQAARAARQRGRNASRTPLFASACPGWTCYVEKAQPAAVSHLSRVKSPQAMTGTLVKRVYGARRFRIVGEGTGACNGGSDSSGSAHADDVSAAAFGGDNDDDSGGAGGAAPIVWHCSVMPCYDKKLESMRPDLQHETDCVLATAEVVELVKRFPQHVAARATDANRTGGGATTPTSDAERHPLDDPLSMHATTVGGASGGYAAEVFRHVCRTVFDVHVPEARALQFTPLRNADLRHLRLYFDTVRGVYTLDARADVDAGAGAGGNNNDERTADAFDKKGTGGGTDGVIGRDRRFRIAYSVALAYGFRNIQNVIRRLKHGTMQWDFVEVMACPGGCSNGGGQWSGTSAGRSAHDGDGNDAAAIKAGTTPGAVANDAAARREQLRRVETAYASMPAVRADESARALEWWRALADSRDGDKENGRDSGGGGSGDDATATTARRSPLQCEFRALAPNDDAVRATADW